METNEICCQLTDLWRKYEPEFTSDDIRKILERGFVFSKPPSSPIDILLMGINPFCPENAKWETYGFDYEKQL